ncbi:MAG: tryptophan--tRNA ligase [Acidobacteria bacterium]|nr:MAG: tryptophan--tRNA ligase [Acidobacteriota bacterium]
MSPEVSKKPRVLSGMRPTGKLHLGNLVGALNNWVKLQNRYDCFHFIADWHALTSDFADTSKVKEYRVEMMIDWLAAGLDPRKSVMFIQSAVPQHAELHLILSMITPLGWLERVPSYKEQKENLTDRDLGNYGFLGYPVLQAADILMYKGNFVPVGEDQVPHVELTREICRRFNSYYGEVFPEPEALLTPVPRLPGLDGRKMSKSYGNVIYLSDTPEEITKKVRVMMTDPARKRRSDPGDPDVCPVFSYHKIYSPDETIQTVNRECRTAGIGCIECKQSMSQHLIESLSPLLHRRKEYESSKSDILDIMEEGNHKAREEAERTMEEVRRAVKLA